MQGFSDKGTDVSTAAPAWSDSELRDPHGNREKASKVRGMFGAIAGKYDLNNRVHSLWRDQAWRRAAVRAAGVRSGDVVVDVACGTGDLTEMFAGTAAGRVIGVDFTPEMLEIARRKWERKHGESGTGSTGVSSKQEPPVARERVSYLEGDAQALPFADRSADVVSIAFGIRNVVEPAKAVAEFFRILKPGGRLLILEFSQPRMRLARWFNDWYCGKVMPRTATWIAGDTSGAYKYLPMSVATFMEPGAMRGMMEGAGFREVSSRGMTMGVCVCYRGVKR